MRSAVSRTGRLARPTVVAAATAYVVGLLVHRRHLARPTWGSGLIELLDDFAPWFYAPLPAILAIGLALRSPAMTLAGLVGAAAFGSHWGRLLFPAPAGEESAADLTVMTFNVLAWNSSYDSLATVIAAEGPDLVCLQELSPAAAAALGDTLADRYPHRVVQPEPGPAGSGIFSRYPLGDVEAVKLSPRGHWCQRGVVDTPIEPIALVNVHTKIPRLLWSGRRFGIARVPVGFDAERRRVETRGLLDLLDGVTGPILVMGDFNMSDRSPDYRLMRTRLADAFSAAGRGFGFTFPRLGSFPRGLPAPWPVLRLDYVWHSAELQPISARVGQADGSDHHPVIARFTRRPPPRPGSLTPRPLP